MQMKRLLPIMAFASLALSAAAQPQQTTGINAANMNKDVRPADDFFEYACGGWMKANPLPAAYSRYGSFEMLIENNDKRINGILNDLKSKTYAKDNHRKKTERLV